MRGRLDQALGCQQACALDKARFCKVGFRQHDDAVRRFRGEYRRQHARHRTELASKTQFAEVFPRQIGDRRLDLAGRGQDAERNRQIKAAPLLGDVGRRKICGNSPSREIKTGIDQRAAYALSAFPHGGFGKPHNGE